MELCLFICIHSKAYFACTLFFWQRAPIWQAIVSLNLTLIKDIALIKNNAAVGSEIAVELSNLERGGNGGQSGSLGGSSAPRTVGSRARPAPTQTTGKKVVSTQCLHMFFINMIVTCEYRLFASGHYKQTKIKWVFENVIKQAFMQLDIIFWTSLISVNIKW